MNIKLLIRKKFKNIVIADTLKKIRSVFLASDKGAYSLRYDPPYQRNYVWSIIKATYFIESILIHGEIPPFVIFEKEGIWEVIDGRQRAETIIRFINGQFALKPQGLGELWNLCGKTFADLDEELQERILNTNLRFTVVTAKNESEMDAYSEDLIKREIFKRHNLGITKLRTEEISKAQYLQDEIDIYFKNQFKSDATTYDQISRVFAHRAKNIERLMQHIRQLLVLQNIPITRFVDEREDIINQYYDYLSFAASNGNIKENVKGIFQRFIKKVEWLLELKADLEKQTEKASGLIYDTLFWALSISESENIPMEKFNDTVFKSRLINHLDKHVDKYFLGEVNHRARIMDRYSLIADFFFSQLRISFSNYLYSTKQFLVSHKALMSAYLKERYRPGFEHEYFSKTLPTSYVVGDILDMIARGKFNLRPSYQREEVMSRNKASSLIESMLLGLKLHPIYVFIRCDGTTEVIDGQQRLLAIIGYLGKAFKNENGELEYSKKNKFSLKLKQGLLPELDNLKYDQLPEDLQKYLYNYSVQFIEIKQENNKSFAPEALFKRLNHKPCPIYEHTFEYWNSYVDTDIISEIKAVYKRNNWLYVRKSDIHMRNEELVTCLSYLHYMFPGPIPDLQKLSEVLSIYQGRSGVTVRIKDKKFITHLLEHSPFKEDFLQSLISFERNFIEKIKILISTQSGEVVYSVADKRLDSILQLRKGIRFNMGFLMLWLILLSIPIEYIKASKTSVLATIRKIFLLSKRKITVENFEVAIVETWTSINSQVSSLLNIPPR